jgi:hypothetical protein
MEFELVSMKAIASTPQRINPSGFIGFEKTLLG